MAESVKMDFSAQISKGVSKVAQELLGKKQDSPAPQQNTQQDQTTEAVKKNNAMLSKFFDKANEGTRGGGAAGSQVEEDLNELRSGRFAGIFIRAKDTIKSLKETGQEIFGKKEELQKKVLPGGTGTESGTESGAGNFTLPGQSGIFQGDPVSQSADGQPKERERFAGLKAIQEETANKLQASKTETMDYFNKTLFGEGEEKLASVRGRSGTADTPLGMGKPGVNQQMKFLGRTIFEKAEFKKVEISKTAQAGLFGQGSQGKSSMPGSGGGQQSAGEGLSDALAKGGLIAGGIAAGVVKLGSSLAGMYQQAMESQDRTLDSMGYVGSGGGLTSNAEMAQIGLARAKIMGGEGQAQLQNKLGVQFGLRQGIGGSEGAEIFAKLNKYGGFKESKEDFKEILAQGIKGGFEGQRQSEMFSKIASMNEESAKAGFGKGNAQDLASIIAAVSSKGIGADNSLTMTENLNKKFQEEGDLFHQIVLAQKTKEYEDQGMNTSEAILKATAYAQDPTNMKDNINMVSSTLKSSGMGDADIGIILQKQQVATAKQLVDSKTATTKKDPKTGEVTSDGTYNIMDFGQDDFKASTTDYKKATAEFSKTVKVGQSYRATKNAIDNLVVGSAVAQTAYMTQLKITTGMIDMLGGADKGVAGFVKGASDAWDEGKKKDGNWGAFKAVNSKIGGDIYDWGKDMLGLGNPMQKATALTADIKSGKTQIDDRNSAEIAKYLKEISDSNKVSIELTAQQLGLSKDQLKEISKKAKSPFGK